VTCPYNISHQLTVGSLQKHQIKCRRNYPNSGVTICPFNSSHHIPEADQEYHLAHCQDSKLVEMAKFKMRLEDKKLVSVIPEIRVIEADEENWEAEATIKTSYDPNKKASQLPVLRKLDGGTPSQRKEFRAAEKVRLENLNSEGVEKIAGLRRPKFGVGSVDQSSDGSSGGRMEGGKEDVGAVVKRFVTAGMGRVVVGRGRGITGGRSGAGPLGRAEVEDKNSEGVTKLGRGRGRPVRGV